MQTTNSLPTFAEKPAESTSGNSEPKKTQDQINDEIHGIWKAYLTSNTKVDQKPAASPTPQKVQFGNINDAINQVSAPSTVSESIIIDQPVQDLKSITEDQTDNTKVIEVGFQVDTAPSIISEGQILGTIIFNQPQEVAQIEPEFVDEPETEATLPEIAPENPKTSSFLDKKVDWEATYEAVEKPVIKAYKIGKELVGISIDLVREWIFGKASKKKTPEEEAAEKVKKARIQNSFYSIIAAFRRLIGLETFRIFKGKAEQANAQRGTSNTSYMGDSLINLQTGQLTVNTEAEITKMSAAEKKASDKQKSLSMATGKQKGAKVEIAGLEHKGGNSRVVGPNATG